MLTRWQTEDEDGHIEEACGWILFMLVFRGGKKIKSHGAEIRKRGHSLERRAVCRAPPARDAVGSCDSLGIISSFNTGTSWEV